MPNSGKTTINPASRVARTIGFTAALAMMAPLGAMAGNGNNGNGGGKGSDNANQNRNDRGALASSLRSLNAANANENAFANASPNSQVGQIAAYRDQTEEASALIADQNIAANALMDLQGLTDDEIASQYTDGGYDDAVEAATDDYLAATEAAQTANAEREATLAALTGGRTLSDSDLAAFHEMLGL